MLQAVMEQEWRRQQYKAHLDVNILANDRLVVNPGPSAHGRSPSNDAVCHACKVLDLRSNTNLSPLRLAQRFRPARAYIHEAICRAETCQLSATAVADSLRCCARLDCSTAIQCIATIKMGAWVHRIITRAVPTHESTCSLSTRCEYSAP